MRQIIIYIICALLLIIPNPVLGCVGSRPLGMGGSFISIADSIETVYWNPAGLTQLHNEEIHFTLTLNQKDQMGYRSFVAFNHNFNTISTGFSYITRLRRWNVLEEWYVLSLATKLVPNFAVGINGRYEMHSDNFTDRQLDLSALWKVSDHLNIGFLYQSLNNFRPAISYKLSENIIFSLDVYNALHNKNILNGKHKIMWGIELLQKDFGVRLGQYADDLTCGISYKKIDLAVMQRDNAIILLGISF